MTVIRWSPMKELENMKRDMERLFQEFSEPRQRFAWPRAVQSGFVPSVDLYDRKGEIVVKVELPGLDKKDLELTITKDTLAIKGEAKRPEDIKDEDYYLAEIVRGPFNRTVALPMEVDNEKAKATFRDGILEIVLPKKEETRPKEIRIEVA